MTAAHRVVPPARRGRTPSRPGTETAQVQSLTRGLSILECLAGTEGGLTLTDIGQRVALPPSTTHRLLATLQKMGYVYQAGDLGLWYIGLQAFTVGSSFLANRDFATQSHAYMRRLMEQSGETANLAMEHLIAQGADVSGFAFPENGDFILPKRVQVSIETVIGDVRLATHEPFGKREIPLQHLAPLFEPVQFRSNAGPKGFRIGLSLLGKLLIGLEA